ncbi:YceG family protein [Desulfosporosinus hippei]|nr:YceG family protein [Desulfosporosinus hippei]
MNQLFGSPGKDKEGEATEISNGNRTVLKQSNNIFKDILSPLQERGTKYDVYFYRIIGCDDETEYLTRITSLNEQLKLTDNFILFDNSIPVSTDLSVIERLRQLFKPVPLKDFSNGALANLLDSQGYFSLSSNSELNRGIRNAFDTIFNLYIANEYEINLSMAVNFGTKILLWFGEHGKQIIKKSPYNPKVIYWGSPKKHEVYYLILMSLIGCDVLVLNTSFRDEFEYVDKNNEYSMLIKYFKDLPIRSFPEQKAKKEVREKDLPKAIKKEPELPVDQQKPRDLVNLNDPIVVVKLKRTEAIFQEMLVPLKMRSGYIGHPYPILPTYFIRYIGVPVSSDDWEAEYYNSLYDLDRSLQLLGNYLKFIDGIPAPTADENSSIPTGFSSYPFKDRSEVIEQTLRAEILPQFNNELFDNTIKKMFVEIVDLFAEKNKNANFSIVSNFSLKIVTWLNRYVVQLFPKASLNQDQDHNPKILFHGQIKPHEIYLLYALHRLGCDVLYVHSDKDGDKPFQIIDRDNELTHLIQNPNNLTLESFPAEERYIRKSTIAYNASKEIEEVIYGEDVGLFKPWQFENYGTQPITLKTTVDELKILWREPAKLRPEFKIQNKKVYIPNLFAKINGVSEDLNTYWRDLGNLSSATNTKLVSGLPFTNVNYTKQELYQASYLLTDQGLLNEAKVIMSKHYKFNHLRAPLQHFLIGKINELIGSDLFVTAVDNKFKLKIIMTILTMEDEILKLIEVFDFPQEIPKIVIYDHKKQSFSESDAIILAYFNRIGLDILVLTPTSYKTIDQFIKPCFFDLFQLPQVKFDLDMPSLADIPAASSQKPGLLSRFFHLR